MANSSGSRPRSLRLKLAAALAVGLLGIVVLTISFLTLTQPGLRLLVRSASSFAPGTLSIDQVRGRLAGLMRFTGIRYSDGDLEVETAELQGRLRLAALPALKVDLSGLNASGLTVHLPGPGEEQPAQTRPPVIRTPVTFSLSEGVVQDLTIIPFGGQPFAVNRISATCSIGRHGFKVKSITTLKGSLEAEISGGIETDTADSINFRYAWSFRPKGAAAFLGEGEAAGSWENLTVRNRLTSPFTSDLTLYLKDPVSEPSARVALSFRDLSPAGIVPGWPEGDLSGEAAGTGTPDSFSLSADVGGRIAGTVDIKGDLSLTRQGSLWELVSGKLESVSMGTRLSLSGRIDTGDKTAPLTFSARWKDLSWPPGQAQTLFASPEGELTARGRLEDFRAGLRARVEGKGIQPGMCSFSGSGNEEVFTLDTFRFPLLGGEVRGEGSVRWLDQLAWHFTAKGSNLDPGRLREDWPGRVFLSVEGSGSRMEEDRSLVLKAIGIDGRLRGNDLGGSIELTSDESTWRIDQFDLSLGTTRLTARGTAGEKLDLAASFASGDVGVLAAGMSGSAGGSVTLTGPKDSPRIRMRVQGENLGLGSFRTGHLSLNADAALKPDAPFTLEVAVREALYGERRLDSLSLDGSGTMQNHRITINAVRGSGSDSVQLDGGLESGTWKGSLTASLLGGSVSGRGSVSIEEPYRWSAALDAKGIDPGIWQPELAGEISLKAHGRGNGGPGSRQWSAGIDELSGTTVGLPVLGAALIEARRGRTVVSTLDLRLGRSSLVGSGEISPELGIDIGIEVPSLKEFIEQADGQAELTAAVTGRISSPIVRLEGSATGFHLPRASFGNASINAVFGLRPEDPAVVKARVEKGLLGSRSIDAVSLSVDGTMSSHHGILLVRSPVTDAEVTISGQLKEHAWAGSTDGRVLDGTFRIMGGVKWQGPLQWNARFTAADLKPQLIASFMPGQLSFSGQASGENTAKGPTASLIVDKLSGVYRDRPVSGQADLEQSPEGFTIRTLDLGIGGGSFSLSGRALTRWDLKWTLDLPDLSSLAANLGGSVAGSGQVTGPRDGPRARMAARAAGLAYGSVRVEEAALEADIGLTGSVQITGRLARMSGGRFSVSSASLTAGGSLTDHTAAFELASPHGDLNINLAGGVRDASWTGQVTRWQITSDQFGNWALAGNAPVFLGGAYPGETIQAGPICLESGDGRICAKSDWVRGGSRGSASLRWTGLGLSMAEGFMPAGFDIRGSSQGHVELSAAEGGTSFTGQIRTSAGSLAYSQTGAKEAAELAYVFRGIEAGATIDKDGLKSRLDVRMGKEKGLDEQFLRGTFEVPGMRIPAVADPGSLQIKGSLKARFADLDLIEAFVPELSGVAGVFTANIAAGGTASEPRASGRMSLTEGTVKLVTPGITLEQIDFTADFDPGRKIRVKGSAASGKGTLSAEGVLTLDAEQGWPVDLKLAGDSFESARTPYIHVLVSPELDINYQSGKVQVNGTVLVPEASVEPAEYVTASAPSSDVTVKGRQAATVQARPVEVQADVTVILGEKITFKGYGLTGRISGSIDVTERPGEPTTAAGELQVNDGEYRAFGRTLTIERGRLIFTGGQIDNPGLDVRAVRVVRGVTAGVQVSGTLISPALTLISEPVMEESEILSYLVLGRPLDQASSEDAQDLSSAATAVSLAGGLAIAKEIGQRFGIEEVRIETGEETEDSTLVVGKYLSPRVYVQYGVGLFQSISVFRFGYQLSKRFLLEGESGVDSGADLIFSIDRK